jgi:hypothetical protein
MENIISVESRKYPYQDRIKSGYLGSLYCGDYGGYKVSKQFVGLYTLRYAAADAVASKANASKANASAEVNARDLRGPDVVELLFELAAAEKVSIADILQKYSGKNCKLKLIFYPREIVEYFEPTEYDGNETPHINNYVISSKHTDAFVVEMEKITNYTTDEIGQNAANIKENLLRVLSAYNNWRKIRYATYKLTAEEMAAVVTPIL